MSDKTVKNLATDERLEKLINLHYEGAQAAPHARVFCEGWRGARDGFARGDCPYSNTYQPPPTADCFDGAFYVRLYIHWNYGYDAYLRWSSPPQITS